MNKETKKVYDFLISNNQVQRLVWEGFDISDLMDWSALYCGFLIKEDKNPFPELNYALVDYYILAEKLIHELSVEPLVSDYIQCDYLDGFYNFD